MTTDLERWQEFVARLDELGRTITAPPFPATPADDLEGLRHLALQAVCWMELAASSVARRTASSAGPGRARQLHTNRRTKVSWPVSPGNTRRQRLDW